MPLLYHLGSPKWEITEALRGESFSRHSLSSRPELGLKAHGQWVEWEEPVVEIGSLGSGLHSALDSPRLCLDVTFAWKIPWMEKSGGLQFMGFLRVGHD